MSIIDKFTDNSFDHISFFKDREEYEEYCRQEGITVVQRRQQAALSLPQPVDDGDTCEVAFGTEPPCAGWVYCGEMMWKRGIKPKVAD